MGRAVDVYRERVCTVEGEGLRWQRVSTLWGRQHHREIDKRRRKVSESEWREVRGKVGDEEGGAAGGAEKGRG